MRPAVVIALAFVPILLVPSPSRAQKPAPVENVSTFEPRTPADERKALHVPEGFEVQLVAAEPDIHKPLNIAFDDKGRLWVTDTLEYPYPAAPGKTPRDTVKVLSDFGPDGRARSIATFASGLNIPIGVLPLPDCRSALVHSIPDIYRLTDDDGDGKADRREPFYQSIGFKDTHGMTNSFSWGFDGWVYACHGFSNTSTVQGADKNPITMHSGNVYRFRADGSHAEFFTHGQVNPFGLAFDPMGNLYSSDCHSRPLYQLLRGGYYPSFGAPDDGLGFAPEMMTHDHGSTAIDAATYYAADQFPEAYRGRMFVGNVVTNRINQDRIEWRGSSPHAVPIEDFAWSEDNWFRPVDIEIGPDGAFYVADFYNRIIGHYEVPLTHPGRDRERGRIWRIVYRGREAKAPRSDWTAAATEDLVGDLAHPNLVVRTKAANQLVARGRATVAEAVARAEASPKSADQRVHALWVLERLGALPDATLEKAAGDADRMVRTHARRILAERPSLIGSLHEAVRRGLDDPDPNVRRASADALGRHPEDSHIRPLLALWRSSPAEDKHLIHVARMALRDQLRPASAWPFVEGLDLTEHEARDIADVANGVPTPESARFLLAHVERRPEPAANQDRYARHVARYGTPETVAGLLAFVRSKKGDGPMRQVALLKAFQQGTQERGASIDRPTRGLAASLFEALAASKKDDEAVAGIGLAGAFRLGEAKPRLEAIATDPRSADSRQSAAVAALMAIDPRATIPILGRSVADPSATIARRERAATSLAAIDRPEARAELIRALATAPERLQATIAAGLALRRPGAEALLDAVAAGKASARLLQERRVSVALGIAKVPDMEKRVAELTRGLPAADSKLLDLLRKRREAFDPAKADAGLGARVFETNCANCHQVGGKGARVGPQLDGIGDRGADRLIEDILDPNRNVDQAFRLTRVALKDGRLVSGLLLKEEGEVLVIADAQGKEQRVPKEMVEEQALAQLSPMPANFAEQISEADFNNLLGFLLSKRAE